MLNNASEERFSLLGLCIRENFVAGVKICLEKKVGVDECCAEMRDFKTTRFRFSFLFSLVFSRKIFFAVV